MPYKSLDAIGEIEESDSSSRLLAKWKAYEAQVQAEIASNKEILRSDASDRVTALAHHFLGNVCRQNENGMTRMLTEDEINELNKKQKPSIGQKLTLALATALKVGGAAVGALGAITGAGAATTAAMNATGSIMEGVGRTGDNMQGMIRDTDQANATTLSHKMERHKREMEAMRQAFQMHEREKQRAQENEARNREAESQSKRSITQV